MKFIKPRDLNMNYLMILLIFSSIPISTGCIQKESDEIVTVAGEKKYMGKKYLDIYRVSSIHLQGTWTENGQPSHFEFWLARTNDGKSFSQLTVNEMGILQNPQGTYIMEKGERDAKQVAGPLERFDFSEAVPFWENMFHYDDSYWKSDWIVRSGHYKTRDVLWVNFSRLWYYRTWGVDIPGDFIVFSDEAIIDRQTGSLVHLDFQGENGDESYNYTLKIKDMDVNLWRDPESFSVSNFTREMGR